MQTTTSLVNDTKSSVDCAKLCPCGGPAIPVPDQWLEVMVTGGFKVWHIIFIIIAFVVTMVVVYCCFHRCRIPRTKQEIEADLMRSNLANKFRDYLFELPNEPTTFVEALKKVQDIEEKLEQDDAMMSRDLGARKRMGWLKLKGKGDGKGDPAKEDADIKDERKVTSANGNLESVTADDTKVKSSDGILLPSKDLNASKDFPSITPSLTLPSPSKPPDINGSKLAKTRNSQKQEATQLSATKTILLKPVEPKQRESRKRDKSRPKLQVADKTDGHSNIDGGNSAINDNQQVRDSLPSQALPGVKTAKRKRQKPNLSRTKGTRRDKQSSISPPNELPPPQLPIELAENAMETLKMIRDERTS